MLDTEQTGTRDNQVCQLSCIGILPTGETSSANFYFSVDDMSEYATAVHKFTISTLSRLSNGARFKDSAREIAAKLRDCRIAGHGITNDLRCLKTEFARAGISFTPTSAFCTMKHFAPIMRIPVSGQRRPKDPNLSELCDYLGVTKDAIEKCEKIFFKESSRQHDARYDACATFLCIAKASNRGMVRGILPEGW